MSYHHLQNLHTQNSCPYASVCELKPILQEILAERKNSESDEVTSYRGRLHKYFDSTIKVDEKSRIYLETVLARTVPENRIARLADALIAHFGSADDVFATQPHLLREVPGIETETVYDFALMSYAAEHKLHARLKHIPILGSNKTVIAYCKAAMAHETREQFRVLFLDKRNRLIRDEVQQVGTVDHTPVYPREVMRRALELAATAVILVHNHPSGDPTPSRADIEMTRTIIATARALGITVHDHIIIGRNGHASLKALELI